MRTFVVYRQRCRGSCQIWIRELYRRMPSGVEENLDTWHAIGPKQANDWVSCVAIAVERATSTRKMSSFIPRRGCFVFRR